MNDHIDGADISAFLDGALTSADRARVEEHLPRCPDCRREEESLRRMKLALSSAPRKTMPADLALALERRLVRGEPWWAPLSRSAFWIPVGAVATAALAVGLWELRSNAAAELPLEPLLAAHARYSAEAMASQEHLVAANYSDQLASLYADSSDSELE